MIDYAIAIPSYHRPECIRDKTLSLLFDAGIPAKKITIFVSTEEDAEKYQEIVPSNLYTQIVNLNVRGIGKTRNAIHDHYPEKKCIIEIDDDIKGLFFRKDDKTLVPVGDKLEQVIDAGFKLCLANGIGLWGVYPIANPFFMSSGYTTKLCYIIAAFMGVINTHDPAMKVHVDDKEDFERSILFYRRDKKLLRFNTVCIDSAYYKEKGGMQDHRTEATIRAGADYLLKTYPLYCKENPNKKHAEVKLVDLTGA